MAQCDFMNFKLIMKVLRWSLPWHAHLAVWFHVSFIFVIILFVTEHKSDTSNLNHALELVTDIIKKVDKQVLEYEKKMRVTEIYQKMESKSYATYKGWTVNNILMVVLSQFLTLFVIFRWSKVHSWWFLPFYFQVITGRYIAVETKHCETHNR